MKNVRITMADDVYEQIAAKAQVAGFSGISSYLLSLAGGDADESEVESILNRAREPAMTLTTVGKQFRLKALFGKDEWESYSKGVRIKAGKRFYADVIARKLPNIDEGPLTGSNHQTYIRSR